MLLNIYRSVYVMVDIRSKILIYQSMCTYNHIRLSSAFLRISMAKIRLDNSSKKILMYIQVGISTAKLGRVICSRDDETVFINSSKPSKLGKHMHR